jgi:hypothetical protein
MEEYRLLVFENKILRRIFGPKGAPTHAILIAQYQVFTVIIDIVGAVLKVCTVIKEILSFFEIYYADRLVSIFIAPSSVNIV